MAVQIPLKAKLDLLPALGSILLSILYALITALYNRRARTWYLHIGYAVLRKATRRLSPAQLQYVWPFFTGRMEEGLTNGLTLDMCRRRRRPCTTPT